MDVVDEWLPTLVVPLVPAPREVSWWVDRRGGEGEAEVTVRAGAVRLGANDRWDGGGLEFGVAVAAIFHGVCMCACVWDREGGREKYTNIIHSASTRTIACKTSYAGAWLSTT